MSVVVTNRPNGINLSNCGGSKTTTDSRRVTVKDSRRKQQWVDPLPPTPPRSPSASPDPLNDPTETIMDDIWELWAGSGLIDELEEEQKVTLDEAFNQLGFTNQDVSFTNSSQYLHTEEFTTSNIKKTITTEFDTGFLNNLDHGDITVEDDNDELLRNLLQFVPDDSPPPTNPSSPPAPRDMDIASTIIINENHHVQIKEELTSSPTSIDGDSDEAYISNDEAFNSDGGIEIDESPLLDEGLGFGDEFMSTHDDLFGENCSSLNYLFTSNTFFEEDEAQIKHDCMWNGIGDDSSIKSTTISCTNASMSSPMPKELKLDIDSINTKLETPTALTDEFLRTRIKIEPNFIVKAEPFEDAGVSLGNDDAMSWDESFSMWDEPNGESSSHPESTITTPAGVALKGLDWGGQSKEHYEHELELRRKATRNDHSYANLNYCEPRPMAEPMRKNTLSGFVLQENGDENGGMRKTKILVPLKELMDSLQSQTFLVAPFGPGKKVIRLTGSETVKGMLGAHHTSFKSVSSYCIPQTSLFNRSGSHKLQGTLLSSLSNNLANYNNSSNNSIVSSSTSNSGHSRYKKSKANRSIIREGGTITFPNQESSPSSPESLVSSSISSGESSPTSTTPSTGLTASGRPKKTKSHNNMERMRRIDLRNSFESLKKLVPPLAKVSKSSKVEILRRSEEYVRALKSLEKRLLKEEATLRSRNEALKLKLLHSQPY